MINNAPLRYYQLSFCLPLAQWVFYMLVHQYLWFAEKTDFTTHGLGLVCVLTYHACHISVFNCQTLQHMQLSHHSIFPKVYKKIKSKLGLNCLYV